MHHKLPVLAVDGDEVARADGLEQLAQLVPMGVPGDVDVVGVGREDARAVPVQVVDGAVDEPLVAGDGPRREQHPVAGLNVDQVVALGREP